MCENKEYIAKNCDTNEDNVDFYWKGGPALIVGLISVLLVHETS